VRASRLLSLLLLLQTRGGMTAAALASELEVSIRTIYRDVEALGAAGIPVYCEPGPHGGVRLVDGYRTRLTGFTEREADAVLLAGAPAAVAQLGLGTVLAAAELKVLAALPTELRGRAARVRQRFHLDAPGWFRPPDDVPVLGALAEAVWSENRVTMQYGRIGDSARRTVDPLGLVLKGGIWYLVARHRQRQRIYRVSRCISLDVLDVRFERPTGFVLAEQWDLSQHEFEVSILRYIIDCRLSPVGLDRLSSVIERGPARLALASASAPDENGWTRMRLPAEQFGHATVEVMSLAPEIEVLGPPELVRWVVETAARMAAIHGGSS
jgi:predicted DNA-binding transcriptional regulator YafY